MSTNDDRRATDEVALRDLIVGEPAVQRVLDGEAARARAEQLVRDLGSDPRVVDVVGRIGDPGARSGAGSTGRAGDDPSVRGADEQASEIQRPTQRMGAAGLLELDAPAAGASAKLPAVTSPHLDPHKRVTDPRLHHRGGSEPTPIDEVDEALERARRSLRTSAGEARADHQRLAVLGAAALAVGIILLALVLTRDGKPKPTVPTASSAAQPGPSAALDDRALIPVETMLPDPPGSAATPGAAQTALGQGPSTAGPAAAPAALAAPGAIGKPPLSSTGDRSSAPAANPKSSAPYPGPGQDAPGSVPVPAPRPSSDRPF